MAKPQSVNQWLGKTAIALAVIGLGAASAYAIWPASESIKLAPLSVTLEPSGLKGDALAAETQAASQLFDRATTTAYAPQAVREVIVTLEEKSSIRAIKIFGSSPYRLNVDADQGGSWSAIAGLQNMDLSRLGEAWSSIPASALTGRLRFTLVPVVNVIDSSEHHHKSDKHDDDHDHQKSNGPAEIEIWGDGARVNIKNVATLLDALKQKSELPAQARLYLATPEQGVIGAPDKMTDDLSDNTFKVKLPRNPTDYKHIYLAYEANGIAHWVHALRQINGNASLGGFGLPISEKWSNQLEEINPAWLKLGDNSITFAPPKGASGSFTVKNVRLIGELDNGSNFVTSANSNASDAGAQSVLDGDTSTGWRPYGASSHDGTPKLTLGFDKPTQVSDLKFFLNNQLKGKFQIEYLVDEDHWIPAPRGAIEGKNLVAGWNMLEVPSGGIVNAMRLVFASGSGSSADIREIVVSGSSKGDTWPTAINFSYPDAGQYFGRIAYLRGYLQPVANESGLAELSVGGKKITQTDGAFGIAISKDDIGLKKQSDRSAWSVEVKASFPNGKSISRTIKLNNYADAIDPKLTKLPSTYRKTAKPGQHEQLEFDGAGLELSGDEIDKDITLGISALTPQQLAAVNPGMTNVTKAGQGYRFTPTPIKFKNKLQVTIPYDPALLPKGKTEKDIKTYYYDTANNKWRELQRARIDSVNKKIVSLSDHFTDMIAATVTVPEHPDAVSFNPNSIKDIKAADPGAGINLIEPPKPNNMGDARLSYPIEIPPGRQGMQPQLSVNYSSGGGNGWMGLGWDIPQQSISIDTRWGVPRYDANKETETYLLDGEQLTPLAHRDAILRDRNISGDKIFHSRIEGAFRMIKRHGNTPSTYWWEVTDKNGVRYSYGGSQSGGADSQTVLTPPGGGNIFKWMLKEVRDAHGNTVNYYYDLVNNTSDPQSWSQIYLSRISYTGTQGADGPYEILFSREGGRTDVVIDGRAGFKTVMNQRLVKIDVRYRNAANPLVRRYVFNYDYGAFNKTLLKSVTQYGEQGESGQAFNSHTFKYYDEARKDGSYKGFSTAQDWEGLLIDVPSNSGKESLMRGRGAPSALGGTKGNGTGGALYVGVGPQHTGNTSTKSDTGGFKFGYSELRSRTFVTMTDMNGDGLPDKVFNSGNKVYYRPNLHGKTGKMKFGSPEPTDLSEIGTERSITSTFGTEHYFILPGTPYSSADTYTDTDNYLSDVNGDGITDAVSGGQVLFGYLSDGEMKYSPKSEFTPVPISKGSIDTSRLLKNNAEIEAQRARDFPLLDTVRRWVAPYDGVIKIDAPVALVREISKARDDYSKKADGVRVAIQLENSELWSTLIGADDYGMHTPTDVQAVTVKKGDRLYFRVQSIYDGAYDRVTWSPVIVYTNNDANLRDENNLSPYRYEIAKEFTLAGRRTPVEAPVKGTVHITGVIEKTAATTDDVTILFTRNGQDVMRRTLLNSETATVDLVKDIQVEPRDVLEWRVLTDSPIDIGKIKFGQGAELKAFYTAAFSAPVQVGVPGEAIPVVDELGRPTLLLKPVMDFELYPDNDLAAPRDAYLVPNSGQVTVEYAVTAKLSAKHIADDGNKVPLVLTVKRAGALRAKKYVELIAPETGVAFTRKFTIALDVVKGEKLYFDLSTRDAHGMEKIVSHSASITTANLLEPVSVFSVLNSAVPTGDVYPASFRGWTIFGYNGNDLRANQPIIQANLKLPETNPLPPTFRAADMNVFPFNAQSAEVLWGGVDDKAWASAIEMSASRLGMDNISMPKSNEFDTAVAVPRMSYSSAITRGPFMYNKTTGSTDSSIDFQDLNGDRFPDVISPGGVQFTSMTGGLENTACESRVKSGNPDDNGAGQDSGSGNPSGSIPPCVNLVARHSSNSSQYFDFGGLASPGAFLARASGRVNPDGGSSANGSQTGHSEPSFSAGHGESNSDVDTDLIDMNGDGLLDIVTKDGDVALNLGYGFGAAERWATAEINAGRTQNNDISMGYSNESGSIAGGMSLSYGLARTDATYVDINGDGLPDKVTGSSPLMVSFNTGAGFLAAREWKGGQGGISRDENANLGGGFYYTYGFNVTIGYVTIYIAINAGLNNSFTRGRPELAFRDMDGDGFVDHVKSSSDDKLSVAPNPIGRTNLLQSVSRPLGANFELEYTRDGNTYDMPQSRWVLSKTKVTDGVQGDGPDTLATAYKYEGGKYNRNERDFYGYAKVTEQQLIAGGQTDTVYRSIEREYLNGNYYTKGLLKRERMVDTNSAPYTETENTYVLRNIDTAQELPNLADADKLTTPTLFPMLTRTDRRFYEGQAGAGKATSVTYAYDMLGNVTRYMDYGDIGTADDVVADISYSQCGNTYIVGKPLSIVVTGNGVLMRQREANIECGNGDILQVRQLLETAQAAVTDLSYFENGNLRSVTGPANARNQRHTVEYTYDQVVDTHITGINDKSYNLNSVAAYNYKYGKVEVTTDTNGNITRMEYDQYGRTTAVYGPYEQGTGTPTIRFEYHPEGEQNRIPFAISYHLDKDANGHQKSSGSIDTILYTDGLKRVLQTKKDASIHVSPMAGTQDVMTVSGRVIFDAQGRTIKQFYPVTEAKGSNYTFNQTLGDGIAPTQTTYDVLDRTTNTILPDGTSTSMIYGFGADRNGLNQFMTTVIDANQRRKESYRDVNELITTVREYNGGQTIQTSYVYDPLKQITQVIDDRGNRTFVKYDNLGRRTVIDNADTGRTETVYDTAGNVIQKITANLKGQGKSVLYDYDYNRLTAISYPTFPANNVSYTYGNSGDAYNRAGRIATVVHAAGVEARYYGKLGETVKENFCRKSEHCRKGSDADRPNSMPGNTVDSHDHEDGHSKANKVTAQSDDGHHDIEHDNDDAPLYVTLYQYDTFGRLQRLTYPDAEVLTYGYDAGGLVKSATGVKGRHTYNYLARLDYDKFDQRVYLKLGNGVETSYTYRQDNRRLEALQAQLPNITRYRFQNLAYRYDNVGNILGIANNSLYPEGQKGIGEEVGGPVAQNFVYDDLYRLKEANGEYRHEADELKRYRMSMAYDTIHNITSKEQLHEEVETEHGKTEVEVEEETTYNYSYQYAAAQAGSNVGNIHPHAPSEIGPYAFQYDSNGNQIERRYREHGEHDDSTRQIVWDEDNRMACVHEFEHHHPRQPMPQTPASCQSTSSHESSDNKSKKDGSHAPEVRFTYNDKGERVYKESHENVSFYLNPHYTEKSDDAFKHILIGTTRLATKEVEDEKHEYEDDQYYYHPDHLGSSSFVTDHKGKLEEHLEYFPFGETWIEEESHLPIAFQFTAKELDSETGLYYYGARYYDPRTSVWQSADPILGKYLPTGNKEKDAQLAGMGGTFNSLNLAMYTYGHQNPVKFTDPDGNLALHWHFIITYNAARDSGRSFSESLRLAKEAMAVDWRDGSQGMGEGSTKFHAMSGIKNGTADKYQTSQEAIDATKQFIDESINGQKKDVAAALHASEDLATPGHAGKEWRGFKWTPLPTLSNIFNAEEWGKAWSDFKNTWSHILGDTFPTDAVKKEAYDNAVKVLKQADAKSEQ